MDAPAPTSDGYPVVTVHHFITLHSELSNTRPLSPAEEEGFLAIASALFTPKGHRMSFPGTPPPLTRTPFVQSPSNNIRSHSFRSPPPPSPDRLRHQQTSDTPMIVPDAHEGAGAVTPPMQQSLLTSMSSLDLGEPAIFDPDALEGVARDAPFWCPPDVHVAPLTDVVAPWDVDPGTRRDLSSVLVIQMVSVLLYDYHARLAQYLCLI